MPNTNKTNRQCGLYTASV